MNTKFNLRVIFIGKRQISRLGKVGLFESIFRSGKASSKDSNVAFKKYKHHIAQTDISDKEKKGKKNEYS